MINLTSKDLILPRCKRIKQLIEDLKKQLENLSEYGENKLKASVKNFVKEITLL